MKKTILTFTGIVFILFLTAVYVQSNGDMKDNKSDSYAEGDVVTIKIEGLSFNPKKVVVKPGTTIRWINLDPIDHDVTSGKAVVGRKTRGMKQTKFPDGKFKSGTFGKDTEFEVTLKDKGEYPYYCTIHPFMVGKVVVK